MGVPLCHIKLINEWLTNRFIFAKSGTKTSSLRAILKGLPQGGVICCILWAVFINDLPDQLQNLVCTLLFADDVQLAPLDEGDAGTLQMIKALHISTSWANKWRLVWSLIKSVYLCSKISVNLSDISLYGTPLKQVKTTKYLGLHYSHDGT